MLRMVAVTMPLHTSPGLDRTWAILSLSGNWPPSACMCSWLLAVSVEETRRRQPGDRLSYIHAIWNIWMTTTSACWVVGWPATLHDLPNPVTTGTYIHCHRKHLPWISSDHDSHPVFQRSWSLASWVNPGGLISPLKRHHGT